MVLLRSREDFVEYMKEIDRDCHIFVTHKYKEPKQFPCYVDSTFYVSRDESDLDPDYYVHEFTYEV